MIYRAKGEERGKSFRIEILFGCVSVCLVHLSGLNKGGRQKKTRLFRGIAP